MGSFFNSIRSQLRLETVFITVGLEPALNDCVTLTGHQEMIKYYLCNIFFNCAWFYFIYLYMSQF